MLGSRLSLNRLAEWIERRSWLVQLWLWALSCIRHRPTKYPKKRLLGKVIVSVDVAVGSFATGTCQQRVRPCRCALKAEVNRHIASGAMVLCRLMVRALHTCKL